MPTYTAHATAAHARLTKLLAGPQRYAPSAVSTGDLALVAAVQDRLARLVDR